MFTPESSSVVEAIFNECLDLPPNFLHEYNLDRSWDFMVSLSYSPATETESNGLSEHQDGNCFTFVLQDDVGGLEVLKDGGWIPVIPIEGSIIVNIGDAIQFKLVMHECTEEEKNNRKSVIGFSSKNGKENMGNRQR
ncbi:hypothetical protein MKW94_008246 [Papaver nudicaule]|uniref:Fe2OG dioxygenase domain-containing protein n=1 Tax=Papaver nudicaule TaxID=74823 RepID=A0AA41VUN8_PAPNU|nr:hypothetical protein [Papaver nudicaule]